MMSSSRTPLAASGEDDRAEVAFYRVERTRNQYGEAADQSFTVGTYLVKHSFDAGAMSKATGEGATG